MDEDRANLAEIVNLDECAAAFGSGQTAGRIIDRIIDHPDVQDEIEIYGMKDTRQRIGDHIRAANPASANFSDKYAIGVANAREAAVRSIQPILHAAYVTLTDSIAELNAEYMERKLTITNLLEKSRENVPVGATEYMNMHNLAMKLDAARIEHAEKLISLYERIHDLLTNSRREDTKP